MWETKAKAERYLWLLVAPACLGIPLVASHSPHLQTKPVSHTVHAHALPLVSSVPAAETTSLQQVNGITRQNSNLEKFLFFVKKNINWSWVAFSGEHSG